MRGDHPKISRLTCTPLVPLLLAVAAIALPACSNVGQSQTACLIYTAPSTQIVVEQNPVDATDLLKKDPKHYSDYWNHPYDNQFYNFTLKPPGAGPDAVRIAPPWANLSNAVNFHPDSPNYEKGGTLFCGERVSPAGHHRLVVLQYHTCPTPYLYFATFVDVVALVIVPGTPSSLPRDVAKTPQGGVWVTNVVAPPPVRIFAGQPDPKDPSHFTIRYELAGKSDTLDGWLKDDESIELTPQSPLLLRGFGDLPKVSKGMTIQGLPGGGVKVTGP